MCAHQKMGKGSLSSTIENVFVRIEKDDGLVGYGEASPWSIFCAESPEDICNTINKYIAPILVGKNPIEWRKIGLEIDSFLLGREYAKSAVEMGLFDLIGKEFNIPLHDVLGGAVRDSLKLSYSVSEQNIQKELEIIRKLVEKEYSIFKVKVGVLDPSQDAKRLLAIRQNFKNIELRLDFNELGTVYCMRELLPVIKDCNISIIEQPFRAGDENSLLWLSKQFSGIIMADESCRGIRDLYEISQGRCFQAISLKIQKLGGISKTLDIYSVANTYGLACYCGGTSDTGLAALASFEVALCLPNLLSGCDLYFPLEILKNEITIPQMTIKNGTIRPNNRPGIGVNLPEEWFNK